MGGIIGVTTGVSLAIGSYYDVSTRCTMALIIPRYELYFYTNMHFLNYIISYIIDFMLNILFCIEFYKSLATVRGRSFMMSSAIILLVTDGPISTIDCNVQIVVRSITCMYEQVNSQYIAKF